MFKVSIMFGKPEDESKFEAYFERVHVPLGAKVPGISRIELGKAEVVNSTAANPPDFYRVVDLYFENQSALYQAIASGECEAAIADLSTFATGGITMTMSEIEEVPVRNLNQPPAGEHSAEQVAPARPGPLEPLAAVEEE